MAKVLTSISGLPISAASAGFAPTNSADVSAIASGYQVVSSTATQLYAGTAFLTSVNGAPISASRAGNAANASMANSAYYDGTGRLISALPDSAAVSSIASSYAESAASGKLDSTASSQFITSTDGLATTEYVDSSVSSKLDTTAFSTVSSNFLTSETVTATAGDGTYITSINGMGLSGQGGGGAAFPAEINYGGNVRAVVTTGFQDNTATRPTLFISSNPSYNSYPRMMLSENHVGTGKSGAFLADAFEFYTGTGIKVFRVDPTGVSAKEFFLGSGQVYGTNWALNSASVSGGSGTATWQYGTAEYNKLTSVHDTVSANSATWGGGGVDSATVSAIASAYGHSALSSIYAGPGLSYGGADDPMIGINYDGAGPLGTDDNNVLICKTDGTTIGVNAAGELVSLVGGGVDSATVSSIASSYAESAVSSKQDSSAMTAYALSSDVSGVIDTVSANSATWGGGATGNYVETSAVEVGVGYMVTASGTSLAQGSGCTASSLSFAQGRKCNATTVSFAQGLDALAYDCSIAAGGSISAHQTSVAFGYGNRAYENSLVAGTQCSASSRSVALGTMCRATATSMAVGLGVSGYSGVTAFGKYNSGRYGTGENGVAFVIGDGSIGSLHDLMRVTKDGEITMYSSTADTVGTGIMSSIRAISAAATGGGGGVVTATGSASATSGWWPVTTSYLVSSINGSALLPYGYSSLSANSANWTSTNSAVSANSANWNSTRITVFNNSANWTSAYSLISGVTALMDAI